MSGNATLGRVTPVTAPIRHQVASLVRQAILDAVYKPGDRLVERELCELTGASRTSLREGLRELESEGLVTNVPYKGLVVSSVGVEEARGIYDVRCRLEGLLGATTAKRRTDEDLAELKANFAQVRRAVKAKRFDELVGLKRDFYAIMMRCTDNRTLSGILENLHGRVAHFRASVMRRPERARQNLDEIQAIIDAIERRDARAAEKACIEHVRSAGDLVIEMLEEAGSEPS